MHIIATTRFDKTTWKENKEWRIKNNWSGCVYGTPKQTADSLYKDVPMFVLEMNNSKNKIVGIGLVKNKPVTNKRYKIYKDQNYNRYTYKGKYRISRKEMTREEKKLIRAFDILLFTGSRHVKRGQGIIALPKMFMKTKCIDLRMFFRTMFRNRFREEDI
jgi:hypothetical protein